MPLIDARGRILGRLNVIDAALIAFVLLLLPIAFTAVRLFQQPTPVIDRIEPAAQPIGKQRRIAVRGQGLRPFLRAFVNPTGRPYSVIDKAAESTEGIVRLETPEVMEVELPELPAGSYDVYIYDELRELAHRTSAFVLTPLPIVEQVLEVRVRFVVAPGAVEALRIGDTDVTDLTPAKPSDPPQQPAVLTALRVAGRGTATFEVLQVPRSARWFGQSHQDGMVIDASLRIPVHQTPQGVWAYGELTVRAGDPFVFQTRRYAISGIIDSVTFPAETTALPAAPKGGK